jgi:hypothetical protein
MSFLDRAVVVVGADRGGGRALVGGAPSSDAKGVQAGELSAFGPPRWAGHAADLGGDRCGAAPGGRRSARVDDPPPRPGASSAPAGGERRGTQIELASSREELLHEPGPWAGCLAGGDVVGSPPGPPHRAG